MIHIDPAVFQVVTRPDGLHTALQAAIRLEHATLPPYLYALYSLDADRNPAIAGIIASVAVEEMLHLSLACNILNALGGTPSLDDPDFIPTYPGPLPGSIGDGLVVPLEPFSLALVKNVFMQIEEPEEPLEFPTTALAAAAPRTIGAFYRAIQQRIRAGGDALFAPPPRNQVTEGLPGLMAVTNAASAIAAIELIVEQGEGTATSPLDPEGDYAHYYRFAEIFHGRRLRPNPQAGPGTPPDQRFLYDGDPVPFDPDGVRPVPANPKAASYPPGSAARHACDTFNYTYTNLLKSLHATFNGQPQSLRAAIGLMFSMRQQALDLMSGTNLGGTAVGPSFEYQPTLPS
ncbi:MAG: ferritin-like protein [Verrucomicrobiae bacterium]|nr:ferritin-like protein [Verrucomicrobiae bacterium]